MILQEQAQLYKQYRTYGQNFFAFCHEVLGFRELIDEHQQLCTFLQFGGEKFKLILMPRYSFKSSLATIGYSLWRLVQDDSLRVLIYSDATAKAEGFLGAIKNHLLGLDKTSKFRDLYGSWEVDPKRGVWNQSAIVVKPRQQARAEPSIDTAGLETSKVGTHYDLIIFDDLVSDMNTTTKDQMDKVHACYKKALSLLRPGGEVLVVGTRWHFGDLYGRLLAENTTTKQFGVHLRQAEVDGAYPFASIGLTKDFLSQQRQNQGSYLWSCLYQNSPVDDETQVFKSIDFAFYTKIDSKDLYITCCLDPAGGTGNDHAALTVVGWDAQMNGYLLDIEGGERMTPADQLETLFDLHRHWTIRAFGIETNGFQKMLRLDLERRLKEERLKNPRFRMFHIQEFTGTSANTKELRIRALQPYHERGALKFPGERLELLQGRWSDLAFQMLQFPHSAHDDYLDSLAYHLPLARPGGEAIVKDDPPYTSAAWFEREQQQEMIRVMARRPRWTRMPVPGLSFS